MIKLKQLIEMVTGEEQSREEYVLKLSREIVTAFKSGTARYKTTFDYVRGDESVDLLVDIMIIKRPNQEHAFSIAAGYGPRTFVKKDEDALELLIEYNPSAFPKAMNAFVSEIKETVEHEFEHVGQQNFEGLYIISNRYNEPLAYPEEAPQAPSHFHYLTSNVEVPAYVKGLLKRAKVNKITFEQALEDYYSDYKDTFVLYNTSWPTVKKIWKDWAIANRDRLRKFT